MNIDTWAVVLATAAGPIGAVLITFWRERRASLRARRLEIFRTLMATRQIPISREHVNALNLIEVDFYGCENVQKEWLVYKAHLFGGGTEDDAWRDKKERFLANLLCEMARTLRYNIPAMEIFKGGYAPVGWTNVQRRVLEAFEYVHNLSTGQTAVPMVAHVVQHTVAQAPPPQQQTPQDAKAAGPETLPPITLPPAP
jgi:hypothetical protein